MAKIVAEEEGLVRRAHRPFGKRGRPAGADGAPPVDQALAPTVEARRLRYAHALCDLAEEIYALHPEAARHLDRAADLLVQSAGLAPR